MTNQIDFEELQDNTADWFSMNFIQSNYESDNDYVDDLRSLISYLDNNAIDSCIKDLSNIYYSDYTEEQINCYRENIANYLSYEAKFALDNFHYRGIKE